MRWIGMLHLPPLPGSPKYTSSVNAILDRVAHEAKMLADHGAWGVLVENIGDRPYFKNRVPPVTVAVMAVCCRKVRSTVPSSIKLGVNVLRNAAIDGLAVAVASGADFMRVNVWSGTMATDQGLIESQAAKVARYRKYWSADTVRILADIRVKHAQHLVEPRLEDDVDQLVSRSLADAVIVTGPRTGVPPEPDQVERIRRFLPSGYELWLGSGADPQSVQPLTPWINGVIIGSYLRAERRPYRELVPDRVAEWAKCADEIETT